MLRYLVMVMRTPKFQPSVIEAHKDYLSELRMEGVLELAGPFTDQTGDAYMIKAQSLSVAKAIAHKDPIFTSGSSTATVYEWDAA